MRHLFVAALAFGLAGVPPLAAQAVPAPAAPPAAPAQAAPSPATPVVPRVPAPPPATPRPRMAQAPPRVPVPPAVPFPYAGRLVQAPGLLLAPPQGQSYLGVHLMEVSEERARELGLNEPFGVEIMSVASGSPAENAGIQKGDVIIRFRGQRVEGQEQLVRLVRETPIGREVDLAVFRNSSEVNLNVEIGERKAHANVFFNCGGEPCEINIPNIHIRSLDFDIPKPRMVTQSRMLGAELEPLEGQLAEHFGVKEGVLVRAVDANSPASRAELKAGDVIVELAGRRVHDPGQIRNAVRAADAAKAVPVIVMRNRSRVSLELQPQSREDSSFRPGRRVRSRGEQF